MSPVRRIICWAIGLALIGAAHAATDTKKILFLAGPRDHGMPGVMNTNAT